MSEKSGFFNANLSGTTYDRVYDAGDFAEYFASFVGNGIFGGKLNQLQVLASDTPNMNVNIDTGQGFINGYWYSNTEKLAIPITVADGTLPRKDIVVLRLDYSTRAINIYVKTGTPASTPLEPDMVRSGSVYELKLCTISVPAGGTSILQSQIVDHRFEKAYCGLVAGVITQIDATEYVTQLNSYISQLDALLDAGVATDLQNQINTNKSDITNLSNRVNTLETKASSLNTKLITLENITVPTSAWAQATTYTNFPYKAAISHDGILASDISFVKFAPVQQESGNFISGGVDTNIINVYSNSIPAANIVIPFVVLFRVVE